MQGRSDPPGVDDHRGIFLFEGSFLSFLFVRIAFLLFSARESNQVHKKTSMITTRSFATLGAFLAVGLAVFGTLVVHAVKRGREFDRFLTVRGASEKEVKATLAIWPLRFATTAQDLPSLKSSMAAARSTVVGFLKERGILDEEINFGIPTVIDRHDIPVYEQRSPDLPRYKSVVTIVVRSKKVDVVKSAIQQVDKLLDSGISLAGGDYSDRIVFSFDGINEVKPQMIAEATANARASAEKFAKDSRAKVGAIRKATQGILELDDRDAASPEIKVLRVVTTVEFFIE